MKLAITGGTGFVGKRLVDLAVDAGHEVAALTRRPQLDRAGVRWIEGALDGPPALAGLVTSADAVIHVAGVVNAPDRDGFSRGNIDGTRAMIDAASAARIRRFILVSSLAAREPGLSNYGWSKVEAEKLVTATPLDWTVVRPPAVYGPGDMEMRDTFRAAKLGLALMPPPGRISVIHVDDLARLLLALAESPPEPTIFEPDDGTPGGWSHRDFLARAIGEAVGTRPLALALPRPLLMLAALADRLFRGEHAKLTPDRVGYMCHPDWVSDPDKAPPPALWQPRIATREGLAQTAAWYRANGLL
ncbi:NAD-dependent epimerase/dehydratase family protein [Sphingomonas sp. GlSt437]|uniref:NAD-dependent epimerase/dehydratase family protein n=1 Tax=Sphingomonas sp. GlSt437 TaxID=3389970 RepID=UPI003A88E5EE